MGLLQATVKFDKIYVHMKLRYLSSLAIIMATMSSTSMAATTPWWMRPTICKLNPSQCYKTTGDGFDDEFDENSQCWGRKLICPDALKNSTGDVTPMGRAEIARGDAFNPGYDINKLNRDENCFGVRRTIAAGSMVAAPNGQYVNVWCHDISGLLSGDYETVENGVVTFDTQPTCTELAENGIIGIKKGKCYGVKYDLNKYSIECGKTGLLPRRLIVLNGADFFAQPGDTETLTDESAQINTLFDKMESAARERQSKYFD